MKTYLSDYDKNLLLEYLKADARPVAKDLYKLINESKSILVR